MALTNDEISSEFEFVSKQPNANKIFEATRRHHHQYMQKPFPCEMQAVGCDKWHKNEVLGVCDSCKRSRNLKSCFALVHDVQIMARLVNKWLITCTMAVVDSDCQTEFTIFMLSLVLLINLNIYYTYYSFMICAIVTGFFVVLLLAMLHLSKGLNMMDQMRGKYEDVWQQIKPDLSNNLSLDFQPFGPSPKVNRELRQPISTDTDGNLLVLLWATARLSEKGLRKVIYECVRSFKAMSATCFEDMETYEGKGLYWRGPDIKFVSRAKAKAHNDYGGDLRYLKDVLRCTIVCETFSEICCVCSKLEDLDRHEEILIESVKNRFHPKGKSLSGYRDINFVIKLADTNMLCEVQVILKDLLKLKEQSHKDYELARSICMEADYIREKNASVPDERVPRPVKMRPKIILAGLRLSAIVLGGFTIFKYFSFYLHADTNSKGKGVSNSAPVYLLLIAIVLPYLVLIYMLALGFLRGLDGREPKPRTRAALLYSHYLGIGGKYFCEKVLVTQAFAVILQSVSKLPMLSVAANLEETSLTLYWIFVTSLIFNCLHPCFTLRNPCHKREKILAKRAAICDAYNDIVYAFVGSFSLLESAATANAFVSGDLLSYTSNIFPLFHLMSLTHSIEKSWYEVRSSEEIGVQTSSSNTLSASLDAPRVPLTNSLHIAKIFKALWSTSRVDVKTKLPLLPVGFFIVYLSVTLGSVFASMYGLCRNGYPLKTANDICCLCAINEDCSSILPSPLGSSASQSYDLSYFPSEFCNVEWQVDSGKSC